MPNLQENTIYNNNKTQPNIANLSSLVKNLQKSTQTNASNTYKTSITNHFSPETATSIFNPLKNVAPGGPPTSQLQIGQPIATPLEGAKTEPIPE